MFLFSRSPKWVCFKSLASFCGRPKETKTQHVRNESKNVCLIFTLSNNKGLKIIDFAYVYIHPKMHEKVIYQQSFEQRNKVLCLLHIFVDVFVDEGRTQLSLSLSLSLLNHVSKEMEGRRKIASSKIAPNRFHLEDLSWLYLRSDNIKSWSVLPLPRAYRCWGCVAAPLLFPIDAIPPLLPPWGKWDRPPWLVADPAADAAYSESTCGWRKPFQDEARRGGRPVAVLVDVALIGKRECAMICCWCWRWCGCCCPWCAAEAARKPAFLNSWFSALAAWSASLSCLLLSSNAVFSLPKRNFSCVRFSIVFFCLSRFLCEYKRLSARAFSKLSSKVPPSKAFQIVCGVEANERRT